MAASPDARPSPSDRARQAVVLVAAVLNVGATWLLGATPERMQALAPPLPIDPAPWAFGIWGLIYAGLLAFGVYQALPSQAANPRLRAVAAPFVVNTLFALTWALGARMASPWLAGVAIAGLLASAALCYRRLGIGGAPVPAAEGWTCRFPFSVYCGWLTVAAVLTAAGLLSGRLGVPVDALGVPGPVWAALAIAGVGAAGAWVAWERHDLAYAAALVWAFLAVAFRQQEPWIWTSALGMSALLAGTTAWAATWHVEVTRNHPEVVHERLLRGEDAEPPAEPVSSVPSLEPEH